MKKSEFDGVHYDYTDLSFTCGCEAIGDRGWAPCAWSFHRLLAATDAASSLATRYFRLRELFDSVLEGAWTRHPMRAEEEAAMRSFGMQPGLYRQRHHLGRGTVWTADGLEADLDSIPLKARLHLYNSRNADRPTLALAFSSESFDVPLSDEAVESSDSIDVSDYASAQILALVP